MAQVAVSRSFTETDQSRLADQFREFRGTLADAARVTQVSRRRRTQPPNPRHHPDGDTVAARTGSRVQGLKSSRRKGPSRSHPVKPRDPRTLEHQRGAPNGESEQVLRG